ncbi:MAG: type I glyceraldehyde-3-phosphate dehydrogenase [Dehalococcoidia bacterium]|nr:type I glyceraldehyde-3-phosphate dehydrogenase [Dehalococcoidia bacterium]|tara:strand:+ start:1871 stop:2881 length:1011 start_codon:yes stop_codon:yes gene_type:complete
MKKIKIGINGFGRIGRQLTKLIINSDTVELSAINDLADSKTSAHLFKYDTSYGIFNGDIEYNDSEIIINGSKIKKFSERDPAQINWTDQEVDIVVESTGIFTKKDQAEKHISGSVKKVIISAPATDEDITIVLGVNDESYDPSIHNIISNASCTTNCVAPMVKVLNENFSIQYALMSTIHSFTNDQSVLDQPHSDLRRSRTASENIIPTTTGAAKAVVQVIPEMKGKIDGMAYRVPTASVSVTDLTVSLNKNTTSEEINSVFESASKNELMGLLEYSNLPLVSQDFKGNPHSVIFDSLSTIQVQNNFFKIVGWYDNEWGYANRTFNLIEMVSSKLS